MLPLRWIRSGLLADPKKLGRWGEKYCLKYLKGKGFRVVALNYRCKAGEIDLIMSRPDGGIVFVEVKTRTSEEKVKAQDAVRGDKRKRMARAAKNFCRKYDIRNKPLQFDVVAIVLEEKGRPELRHYDNAFVP